MSPRAGIDRRSAAIIPGCNGVHASRPVRLPLGFASRDLPSLHGRARLRAANARQALRRAEIRRRVGEREVSAAAGGRMIKASSKPKASRSSSWISAAAVRRSRPSPPAAWTSVICAADHVLRLANRGLDARIIVGLDEHHSYALLARADSPYTDIAQGREHRHHVARQLHGQHRPLGDQDSRLCRPNATFRSSSAPAAAPRCGPQSRLGRWTPAQS